MALIQAVLRRAIPQEGCPICHLVEEGEERFFIWFILQDYYVPGMMQKLKAGGGLCAEHTRRLLHTRAVYPITVMYEYILADIRDRIVRVLSEAQVENQSTSRWIPWRNDSDLKFSDVQPVAPCPACASREQTTEWAVLALYELLANEMDRTAYQASSGLCLPHFWRAVAKAPADQAELLAEVQLAHLDRLVDDLAEYCRKVDYRYASEPKGAEQDAWLRAADFCAGLNRGRTGEGE